MPVDDAKLALITGASSGIGLAIARRMARDGWRLIVGARASEKFDRAVQELRQLTSVEAVTADLADPTQIDRVVAAVGDRRLDALVNNAGFGTHGLFAETDPQSQTGIVQVNIAAPVDLTRKLLPGMLATHDRSRPARILNVSSVAGFLPGPYMATYYASKAFVTSFSRALHVEMKSRGVTVTALCPGPTTTDFQNRAGVADTPLFRRNVMTADAVADIGYRAMLAGRPLAVCGIKNRLMAMGIKFSPVAMTSRVAAKLNAGR